MPETLTLKPDLLRWARERASLSEEDLARRVHLKPERVSDWEATGRISFPHLERLADKTHTPMGYLFLPAPPDEKLPIRDFRTIESKAVRRPSPDLLETIYACQQRQSWFRDYLVAEGEAPLPFVGSASLGDDPVVLASRMRAAVRIADDWRPPSTYATAVSELAGKFEELRILVMMNGVVGNNTSRKLDVKEFRGFALGDEFAPLVFVNAADAKSAQMFTLVHELAHLWLGHSGVSDVNPNSPNPEERYCNLVAAEFLVPVRQLSRVWRSSENPDNETERVARLFKVSTFVILIRARDAGLLSHEEARSLYDARVEVQTSRPETSGGGNFYATQNSRLGKRFARAVISSALEGRTSYSEAFDLLGVKKAATFERLASYLGVRG